MKRRRHEVELEQPARGVFWQEEDPVAANGHALAGVRDAAAGLADSDAPDEAQRRVVEPVDGAVAAGE